MSYSRELQAALDAAAVAGQAILAHYAAFQAIADAPADITTVADHEGQEIILLHLRRLFPTDGFCAEEATPTLAAAPRAGVRTWVIDPIDGTRGFARKNGEFSVMIGLHVAGQIQLGVVAEPARERLTWAVRGGGCWRRDAAGTETRCHVGSTASLAAATLTQSHSKNPALPSAELLALNPARVVESYSAGIKLALVARGEAELYLNTYDGFHDWDICAGQILVEEAGGTVTGLKGETLIYGSEGAWQRAGLLASNGTIHAESLRALAKLRES